MCQGEYKYASAGPELCLAISFLLLPNELGEMCLAECGGMHWPIWRVCTFGPIYYYMYRANIDGVRHEKG